MAIIFDAESNAKETTPSNGQVPEIRENGVTDPEKIQNNAQPGNEGRPENYPPQETPPQTKLPETRENPEENQNNVQSSNKDVTEQFPPLLVHLLQTELKLRETSAQEIVFSPALVTREGEPIFRRSTINIIQGAQGSHKSRLAETFCSLMIKRETPSESEFVGFQRIDSEELTVCYVDTERNKSEEFPSAIQRIKRLAGYGIEETIDTFRFTSLKDVRRTDRLKALKLYIERVRSKTTNPLFVILDVATDCVSDFNDPKEALSLYDYLGNLCDNYGATFLLVIHVNPGSEKARGHVGTEGVNKSTTVMQIGYFGESGVIKLDYKKNRASKPLEPIYLMYSDQQHGLVLAPGFMVNLAMLERVETAPVEVVREKLSELLHTPLTQQELVPKLMDELGCSRNTVLSRLGVISDGGYIIINQAGEETVLKIVADRGKQTWYELVAAQV